MNTRAQLGFGIGNVITAALLGVARTQLPVRHAFFDGLLIAVAVVLSLSGLLAFMNLRWAPLALRVAAFALLGLGLVAIAVALLTIAFLSSVHGRWLEAGLPYATLALVLIAPYAVIYPVVQLVCVRAEKAAT